MDDVERRVTVAQGQLNRRLKRGLHELVREGHGARSVNHEVDVGTRLTLHQLNNSRHVAKRRAHEQELRARERKQGHLPRPSTVWVTEVVELVHHHPRHRRVFTLAQGLVRKNLRSAADNGRAGVYRDVAGNHADEVAPEDVHQVEELLGDESLYWCRVVSGVVRT